MPCAAGELCMIPNLTPEPPDGHRCRGGCGGRLHGVCGQVVEEDADSDNPLRRICPTCSTAAAGSDDDVSRVVSTKGKRKAGAKQHGRGPGQHHAQPNDGSKPRTQLTRGQKLEMLELLTQKMSHAELARRYKCSARTVSNVAQKREELEAEASSASSPPPAAAAATAAARRTTSDRAGDHGAPPGRAARRKRSSASTTARETQAISSAAGMPCAAGELCMVPSLTPGPPYGHLCPGGCGGQLHDVCGEVVEVEVEEEEDQADSDKNSASSCRVCPTCAAGTNIPAAAVAAAAAAAVAAAAGAAAGAAAHHDDGVSRTSTGTKRKAEEDERGSGSGEHQHQSKLHKPSADTTSKSRTQLTLGQKLEMLKLLTQKVSHRELARRFKCAARTVSNVAQNRAALEAEGTASSGGRIGSSTRKRSAAFPDVDKRVMAVINASRKYKTPVTRARIAALALAAKKALLSTTKPVSPPTTTAATTSTTTTTTAAEERRKRLESFGASEKWAKSFIARNGVAGRVVRGPGTGGSGSGGGSGGREFVVGIANARPEAIEEGMRKVRKECEKYEPENIFSVDEMSLFYKLLPQRSYLSPLAPAPPASASASPTTDTETDTAAEGRQTARGTKDMEPKDRVSAYVCTNATGSAKVPVSIVAAPKSPRSFRGRACPVKYFSQATSSSAGSSGSCGDGSAWGSAGDDGATFREWWVEVFLPYVRRWTRLEVLCLVDACLPPPGEAWLEDPRGQVKVVVYPANCAGKHQPMSWGVIAAAKLHYRRRLVTARVSTMLAAGTLRAEAEERGVVAAGAAGLAEGHPPHLLDAAEMLQAAWDDVSDETIARSWVKADTLPAMHIPRRDLDLSMAQGAAECVLRFRECEDRSGLAELEEALNALSSTVHRARGRGTSSAIDADLVEVLENLDISPGKPADDAAIAAARAWATVEDREDVAEALRLDEQDAILSGTFGYTRAIENGGGEGEEGGARGEQDNDAAFGEGGGGGGGGDGEENGSAAKLGGSVGVLPPPPLPSYAEISPYFVPLEKLAEACGNTDAIYHLRKARMAFIVAHASEEARRANVSSGSCDESSASML